MGEIRVATRAAIRDMDELKGMVDEVLHRLKEDEDEDEYIYVGDRPSCQCSTWYTTRLEAPTPLEALSIGQVCSHSK